MKAFAFDQQLISSYAAFSRSFHTVRAADLREVVETQYEQGRFWPDALLSLNPRYRDNKTVAELVADNALDPATGAIFRIGSQALKLYKHQAEAIVKAQAGRSFVVATGTGSGKSLCFFLPIVDAVVRARRRGEARRTRAIIVYPMNALANSQIKEIEKFVGQSGLPESLRPRVRRYTGQESAAERQEIADNPPDILLTNFMMAELLLTRADDLDARVIANASGLEFIVLDELHTYRGRQGADVAVLVRRLRDRCAQPGRPPICVGTSATMANEGDTASRAQAIADVASRLFGTPIGPDGVIDESLQRATDDELKLDDVRPKLTALLRAPLPDVLTDAQLRRHPLAVWTELAIGLDDGQQLRRKQPIPFSAAVSRLSVDSGLDNETCCTRLQEFLTRVSLPETERGGSGSSAFLAFKLHRFISGAGEIFTTLTAQPRNVLFEGQLEDPAAPGHRLYPTRFCRQCGQEFHLVTQTADAYGETFLARSTDDPPGSASDGERAGYLTPVGDDDAEYVFNGATETFPEDWREPWKAGERLRAAYRKRKPERVTVRPDGRTGTGGRDFWFLPGKFGFCPACLDQPQPAMRERTKLTGISSEGRSSATTQLVTTALEWMNTGDSGLPPDKRKLLGFTDNRQDAALQAGHFNDFLFVSLLRGALLRAVLDSGEDGLSEDEFGLRVVRALGFTADRRAALHYWMLEPTTGVVVREDAQRALARVLAHRVWSDLRRGWRYTNPNLAMLQLLDVRFVGLDEISQDRARFAAFSPELADRTPAQRAEILAQILRFMLEGSAVSSEALDPTLLDTVAQKSRTMLRTPWAIDVREIIVGRRTLMIDAPVKAVKHLREEQILLRAGPSSRLARTINRTKVLGTERKLSRAEYLELINGVLQLFEQEGLVKRVELNDELSGWRLMPAAVRLVAGTAARDGQARGNRFFHRLYLQIAADLRSGRSSYWGIEGREHTAQVSTRQREWREWRFRFEADDREKLQTHQGELKAAGESDQFLPVLFCSPTMELGVDISALNAVYLRNVPPTPANYAQRAGRAGRSGQAAVIVTYCAALSPHDQYFFQRREEMVAGVVRPPALDITNEELVRSHLHAVWLAEARLALSPDIPDILDLQRDGFPLRAEIAAQIQHPTLATTARKAMQRVLEQILDSEGRLPVWMTDTTSFTTEVAANAAERFDRAFDRWRDLYNAARTQLIEANTRSEMTGLSGVDRGKIRAAQIQSGDQITLLEKNRATSGSDFYSYRYLATEGFLPGYNFPRLPLYAFIPGEGSAATFLQRARFLAIAEFGPRSLIYHEGRAYRVVRAKLPPGVRSGDGTQLATRDLTICPQCGACHEEESERCHACKAPLANAIPVRQTLRIDNVEAVPAERITANDEDRVRQGFDIRTVFAWPRQNGRLRITEAGFFCSERQILALQYANSAEISRLNLGLKRRSEQTVFGFSIDPRSGYWAKPDDDDDGNDPAPDLVRPVRVVPIVRDRKNALLLRFSPGETVAPATFATVQHALLRGIEVKYQLEEGEILGEPLPTPRERQAILAYEASEGGAGVLSRLIEDPQAIAEVARQALGLMHFANVADAVAAGDAALLADAAGTACVRGCYRCLLSYYNQTDHQLIDRSSLQARQLLIDLARGEVRPVSPPTAGDNAWHAAFAAAELPLPDGKPLLRGGSTYPYVWRERLVLAAHGPLSAELRDWCADHAYTLFELPAAPDDGIPPALRAALRDEATNDALRTR